MGPASGSPEQPRSRCSSATYEGLEVEAAVAGPLGLRLEGALELLSVSAEASEGFVSKRALRPLSEKLRMEASRTLGAGLSAAVRWMRARRRQGAEPYHLVDARLSYRWERFDVYVEGTNLTDDSYPDITGLHAPGAALVTGLSWSGGAGAR